MNGLAFLLVLLQPASVSCPIERSVYQLSSDPAFTAGFAPQDPHLAFYSDLAVWLRTPRRTYWFSLESPSGQGGTYLVPSVDPRTAAAVDDAPRDADEGQEAPLRIAFDVFGADLGPWPAPPRRGDPAPAFLFARDLGPALWYDWVRLAAGDRSAAQEVMPVGTFRPMACDTGAG